MEQVYKVIFKEKTSQSYWDNKPLLIVASDYANAEAKALNFSGRQGQELLSIEVIGQTTHKKDVFETKR